jgi:hypothetical protein
MKRKAVRSTAAIVLLFFCSQTIEAQIKTARYDVLPVESGVYRQAVNVYVYASPAGPSDARAMPVVYVPLAGENDRAAIERLVGLIQQGTIPYMRIVGIERFAMLTPAREAVPALYINPKGKDEGVLSDDEWFSRFINSEVVPAVEGKYRCNSFKALYIDEGTPLGKHLLSTRSGGFSAYLTPTPFVWFNGEGRPEPAKTFVSYYSGLQAKEAYLMAVEMDEYTDEFYLKTGRLPTIKE